LPWELCRDDPIPEAKGLPAYGTSLHRYLWLRDFGEDSPFVAVTPEAPTNAVCRPIEDVAGDQLAPPNPGVGLMLLRVYAPIAFETFADLLGGAPWRGPVHGRSPISLDETTEALTGEQGEAERLFLGRHGRAGRLVETLHPKPRLLADGVEQVCAYVAAQGRPVLNLSGESFRMRLSSPGRGLPALWTAWGRACRRWRRGGAVAAWNEDHLLSAGGPGRDVDLPRRPRRHPWEGHRSDPPSARRWRRGASGACEASPAGSSRPSRRRSRPPRASC